jgi:hypothetical protein
LRGSAARKSTARGTLARDALARETDQLVGADRRIRLLEHDRLGRFAPLLVGESDRRISSAKCRRWRP